MKQYYISGGGAMEDKKLPRRERQKMLQRQEMLAAALELFSEKGYRNVSMQEIAEKAEFSIGTLYKFFNNKEDLYKGLLLEQFHRFHQALTRAIEEPDDEIQKLRNYVKAKGEVFRANLSTIRLYFAETQGARFNVMAGFDSEIQKRRGEFMKTFASIFEGGMRRQRFKKIAEPYQLAVALESITNAFLLLWLDEPERYPYPEDPDTVLNILLKGLIEG
jgi:TetR/AcrR family transcriptional regulator